MELKKKKKKMKLKKQNKQKKKNEKFQEILTGLSSADCHLQLCGGTCLDSSKLESNMLLSVYMFV